MKSEDMLEGIVRLNEVVPNVLIALEGYQWFDKEYLQKHYAFYHNSFNNQLELKAYDMLKAEVWKKGVGIYIARQKRVEKLIL